MHGYHQHLIVDQRRYSKMAMVVGIKLGWQGPQDNIGQSFNIVLEPWRYDDAYRNAPVARQSAVSTLSGG